MSSNDLTRAQREALLTEIASHLEGWQVESNNDVGVLTHPSGAGLVLSFMWNKPRIEVWPSYTHVDRDNRRMMGNELSMTVAISRGAEQIAKEIKRRILEQVLSQQEIITEMGKRAIARHEAELEQLRLLVAPLSGRVFDGSTCNSRTEGAFQLADGYGYGSIQLNVPLEKPYTGTLHLSGAPIELIERLIATCAQYESEQSN